MLGVGWAGSPLRLVLGPTDAPRRGAVRLKGMSILSSVLVPGVVAASVTALLYWWIQRPRADLDMVKINQTMAVAKLLVRAEKDPDADDAMKDVDARVIVLLTNYGDGTAHDIRLKGTNCSPRVWVRDVGETEGAEVVAGVPMWNDRLGALGAGQMMSVVVTSSPDKDAFSTRARSIEVSWPLLPRRGLCRKKRQYDFATVPTIETGWPGKTDTA